MTHVRGRGGRAVAVATRGGMAAAERGGRLTVGAGGVVRGERGPRRRRDRCLCRRWRTSCGGGWRPGSGACGPASPPARSWRRRWPPCGPPWRPPGPVLRLGRRRARPGAAPRPAAGGRGALRSLGERRPQESVAAGPRPGRRGGSGGALSATDLGKVRLVGGGGEPEE